MVHYHYTGIEAAGRDCQENVVIFPSDAPKFVLNGLEAYNFQGLGLMSQLLGILDITFKYLFEIISPIVGWCETLGHLPTPDFYATSPQKHSDMFFLFFFGLKGRRVLPFGNQAWQFKVPYKPNTFSRNLLDQWMIFQPRLTTRGSTNVESLSSPKGSKRKNPMKNYLKSSHPMEMSRIWMEVSQSRGSLSHHPFKVRIFGFSRTKTIQHSWGIPILRARGPCRWP